MQWHSDILSITWVSKYLLGSLYTHTLCHSPKAPLFCVSWWQLLDPGSVCAKLNNELRHGCIAPNKQTFQHWPEGMAQANGQCVCMCMATRHLHAINTLLKRYGEQGHQRGLTSSILMRTACIPSQTAHSMSCCIGITVVRTTNTQTNAHSKRTEMLWRSWEKTNKQVI